MDDIRGVFDVVIRAHALVERKRKIHNLQCEIRALGTVCGDCDKWMKSRICPKESNVHGQDFGPSCGMLKCHEFVETRWVTNRRESLKKELEAMTCANS